MDIRAEIDRLHKEADEQEKRADELYFSVKVKRAKALKYQKLLDKAIEVAKDGEKES